MSLGIRGGPSSPFSQGRRKKINNVREEGCSLGPLKIMGTESNRQKLKVYLP